MRQLELHKQIEEFFKLGVDSAAADTANRLTANDDAKRFFFSRADEKWLIWLWKKGFLEKLKDKAEDTTRYSYRLPELEYLSRMAEKSPQTVAEIIEATDISKDNFNPEVVDRFLWIIGLLPSEQVVRLLPKIKKEKWVQLMAPFYGFSYQYKTIVEKLEKSEDSESWIKYAEILLFLVS